MTFEEVDNLTRTEAFDKFLELRWENPVVVITERNKYPSDHFLNLKTYPKVEVRIDKSMVEFSNDDPLPCEELPTDFLKTILMNCK